MVHALGVQCREIWQVITGFLSAYVEPSRTMGNSHVMPNVLLNCYSSSLLGGTHRTRVVAHHVCVDHYYMCMDVAYACV